MSKSNFDQFKSIVENYMKNNAVDEPFLSTLHETSLNDSGNMYLYDGKCDFEVVSMDLLAKKAYKIIKNADSQENPVNTADAFLINKENEWYFIEFKDTSIRSDSKTVKDNILKKAYANWYMVLDILYAMKEVAETNSIFEKDNPVRFAKEHVSYILVCSGSKNANIYNQVKNCSLIGKKYTPGFMSRLKYYVFKDAYVYTEDFFEKKFVAEFSYA